MKRSFKQRARSSVYARFEPTLKLATFGVAHLLWPTDQSQGGKERRGERRVRDYAT
jgi:hypothetical protein